MATLPAVGSFGSSFIADGGDGHGEAAAGDHLQATYRFWLVGHQLERGAAPWFDPYSFQPLVEPQVVLAGWPFGLAFWPLDAAFGPVVAWNLLLLTTIVAAGLLTYGWLRALALPPGAAAIGGLVFALAPYRLAQSGVHLLGWIAILMPLALLAYERARAAQSARSAHAWGAVSAAAIVSIPLSGQLHLALGAIPSSRLRPPGARGGHRVPQLDCGRPGGGRRHRPRRAPHDRARLGRGRRPLAGGGGRVLGGLGRPDQPLAARQSGAVRLRGLARSGPGRRRDRPALGTVAGARVDPWRGRGPPSLLALGTNLPLYEWLWDVFPPLRYPARAGRLLPVANLAGPRSSRCGGEHRGRVGPARGGPRRPSFLVLSRPISLFPLDATVADPGKPGLRGPARASPRDASSELPLIEPGVHYGSVYDYTNCRGRGKVPRATPRSLPQPAFDFYPRNRISCGVGCPATRRSSTRRHPLRDLPRGVYAQAEVQGAWFGWRELLAHGYTPIARGGASGR